MTFVGTGFTRKPPKYERFIRPTGLRITKVRCSLVTNSVYPLSDHTGSPDLAFALTPNLRFVGLHIYASTKQLFTVEAHRLVWLVLSPNLHVGLCIHAPTPLLQAHVTHPELKATFCLEIIGIKKNPNGQVRAA